ncbi:hypothetical protein V1527DRAFT_454618 [Lipomyces starkeyi]
MPLTNHLEAKWMNFIVGWFPGWWLREEDNPFEAPFISPERWNLELRNAGFTAVDALA